jgi:hypothetical protein
MKRELPHLTFDARENSILEIASALNRHGLVCIRNCLDRMAVSQNGLAVRENARGLKEMIGKDVNDMPLCFSDLYVSDYPPLPQIGEVNLRDFRDPLTYSKMDRGWYYEGARNYKHWFWKNARKFPNTLITQVLISILPEIYLEYFGQDDAISVYQENSVRYQRSDLKDQSYFFHQDGSYHSRDPKQHTGLTTWIPLNDCGETSPALQFVPKRLDLMPVPADKQMPYLFSDEKEILRKYSEMLWAPMMKIGDIMLFDHLIMHGTYIEAGMTEERQSADIRFFPSTRTPDYVRETIGEGFALKSTAAEARRMRID